MGLKLSSFTCFPALRWFVIWKVNVKPPFLLYVPAVFGLFKIRRKLLFFVFSINVVSVVYTPEICTLYSDYALVCVHVLHRGAYNA